MKKRNLAFCIALSFCCVMACKKECPPPPPEQNVLDEALHEALLNASDGLGIDAYLFPDSDDYPAIPQDPENPITAAKVEAGKFLFHETGLAISARRPAGLNTYSCASCHHAPAGFQAGLRQGIGEGGLGFGVHGEGRGIDPNYSTAYIDIQAIRTPSCLNVAYQKNMLYAGSFGATGVNVGTESHWLANTPLAFNHLGYEGVETQSIGAQIVHLQAVDTNFINSTGYRDLLDAAFPATPVEERYTNITVGLAIAAYERVLLANQAPFQAWLKGDSEAMTDQEKEGAILFFDKANCYSCHNGPALNSMEFYALGMDDLKGEGILGSEPYNGPTNRGRGGFTNNPDDFYKFKVPQLYNLKDSPFMGHGATFTSVYDVIAYKNAAVPQVTHIPEEQFPASFQPLGLSETEMQALTAFVEHALYDPDLQRYVPDALPSGFCFPNNDPQSRLDLGCD